MFEGLKKFKVLTPFNGYRKGLVVAFNGADAEKYKDFIVSTQRVSPVVVDPIVENTVVEEQPQKRKYVRKGRK